MNIQITKSRSNGGIIKDYYEIKGSNEIYNERELLRAVIAMIRANFNITDEKLNEEDRYY